MSPARRSWIRPHPRSHDAARFTPGSAAATPAEFVARMLKFGVRADHRHVVVPGAEVSTTGSKSRDRVPKSNSSIPESGGGEFSGACDAVSSLGDV